MLSRGPSGWLAGSGGEVGGGGKGGGGVGGGAGRFVVVGSDWTSRPSALEAATAVLRLEESEFRTAAAVVEAGTAILAVMITLAAAKVMETDEASTPALVAILLSRAEVSE